jgi:hypothetical protein
MRNPHNWRNTSLAVFASGIVAAPAAFLLPEAVAGDTARGLLFIYGVMALLFGGGTALFQHFDARAKDALARGEDIIARWHVDAATWRDFIALNHGINQEGGMLLNELSIREEVPAAGIEVIAGRTAVQVDGSIHALPRRGTPEITHAELNTSRVRPSYIELHLYYPGGGYGASGVPRPPVRTALRFPVAAGIQAQRDAERVVAHYNGDLPGKPDFYHGSGDGTNAEDLSTCISCGYKTFKYRSHCPQCGAGMQSRRWSRRLGAILLACGLFITCFMGAIIYFTAPLLLQPSVSSSTHFSGTLQQGFFILGIFGVVASFGVTAMLYGVWQIQTGQRSKKIIYFMLGLFTLLSAVAALI